MLPSSNPRRSSNGTGDWWPRSSMVRDFANSTDGLLLKPRLKTWSSVWRETILRGATTESPEPFTILVTTSAIRRWATSSSGTALGHRLSDDGIRHGAILFVGTGKCYGRRISSRQRFGRAVD